MEKCEKKKPNFFYYLNEIYASLHTMPVCLCPWMYAITNKPCRWDSVGVCVIRYRPINWGLQQRDSFTIVFFSHFLCFFFFFFSTVCVISRSFGIFILDIRVKKKFFFHALLPFQFAIWMAFKAENLLLFLNHNSYFCAILLQCMWCVVIVLLLFFYFVLVYVL